MSEKCPNCGAPEFASSINRTVLSFDCRSITKDGEMFDQSDKCRIAELEKEVERMRGRVTCEDDCMYVRLSDTPTKAVFKTIEMKVTLCTLDYNANGEPVGLELLIPRLSRNLRASALLKGEKEGKGNHDS